MKFGTLLAGFGALSMSAGLAVAQDAAPAAQEPAATAGAPASVAVAGDAASAAEPDKRGLSDRSEFGDPNRVICRRMSVTGSRLAKTRLCYTARQWENMKNDTRQKVELAQQQKWGQGN